MIFPPLGILYIGATLEKAGYQVKIDDIFPNSNYDDVIDRVKDYQPDLIGISINTPQFYLASQLIGKIKQSTNGVKIVCGGIHPTIFAKEMIERLGIDFVVLGEGERTIVELCAAIKNNKDLSNISGIAYRDYQDNKATINPPRPLIDNIDAIPFPARHLVDFNRYLKPPGTMRGLWMKKCTTMMSARGCPGGCIFCASKILFGRKVRKRSAGNVLEEIKSLKKIYNIDGLQFLDDTFTINKQWLLEFLKEFRKLRYNLTWGCQSKVSDIDDEIVKELVASGCKQLDFGVESGSQKVLDNLKKGTTVAQIIKTFNITKKYKIRRLATFMIGNPGETDEDIKMSYELAKKIKPDFATFFYTTPYPGTELFDYAKRNNYLKTENFSGFFVRRPGILEINFKKEELIKIRRRLQNSFMWKNISSYSKNPQYIFNVILFLIRNIRPTFTVLKKFAHTKNFDDVTYGMFTHAK